MRTGAFLVAAVLVYVIACATPTALTIEVFSEVTCDKGASVVLVVGGALSDLPMRAPSATSSACTSAGAEARMGSVVVVPAGAKNESVAFAVMTRPDGESPDKCLDPTEASACIVAIRELLFLPHTELDMRVDLRLSCLGVTCSEDETCVKGACVSAQVTASTCAGSCSEGSLGNGGVDSGLDAPRTGDALVPPKDDGGSSDATGKGDSAADASGTDASTGSAMDASLDSAVDSNLDSSSALDGGCGVCPGTELCCASTHLCYARLCLACCMQPPDS